MSIAGKAPSTKLAVDRNGAGAGTALLDTTYRGTTVGVGGMDRVKLRLRYTKGGGDSVTIRCRDASEGPDAAVNAGTFPLLSQSQSHNSGAGETDTEHAYAATADDVITLDLKGSVDRLAVEVKAAGTVNATDRVIVEVTAVEG